MDPASILPPLHVLLPALALGMSLGVCAILVAVTSRRAGVGRRGAAATLEAVQAAQTRRLHGIRQQLASPPPPQPQGADAALHDCPDGAISVVDAGSARFEVQTWGGHHLAAAPSPLSIFIMIPGNPGAVEPYVPFMEAVQRVAAASGPPAAHSIRTFMTVGHSGHAARTAQAEGVDLDAQIEHKRAFLAALLTRYPHATLHFGGHSVGAHIVTELMRHLPPANVGTAVLLFPTLSHIGATPNGLRLTPAFRHLRGLAGWLVWVVTCLPAPLRRAVLGRLSGGVAGDAGSLDALERSVLVPAVIQNAFFMAMHEMEQIRELDAAHYRTIEVRSLLTSGIVLLCEICRPAHTLTRPASSRPPAGEAVHLLRRRRRLGEGVGRGRHPGGAAAGHRGALRGGAQARVCAQRGELGGPRGPHVGVDFARQRCGHAESACHNYCKAAGQHHCWGDGAPVACARYCWWEGQVAWSPRGCKWWRRQRQVRDLLILSNSYFGVLCRTLRVRNLSPRLRSIPP